MTNQATGKIKASRVNNLDAETYVGPAGQLWYDVDTGILRLGDNVTPGGTIVGGGGGNGSPGGANRTIQFNNDGSFAGNSSLTYNIVGNTLSLNGVFSATGNVIGNYFIGNGSQLTGISANYGNSNVADYLSTYTGNITANTISATGNITSTYFLGNGSQLTGISTGQVFVTSSITTLQPGYPLEFSVNYSNSIYAGGVFTLYQPIPPNLTITNYWSSTVSVNKDQYANFLANTVNTSNITMSMTSGNANFNIQPSDYILIGTANITGSNITGLGIGTGNTANITISSNLITEPQTAASSEVTARLTTTTGSNTVTGNTLTTTAPTQFSLNSVSASWNYPNIISNVGNSQPINWSVISGIGTVVQGNIIITGSANITQSANTTLSGNTENVISTLGDFDIQASYLGDGLNGYGQSYSNVSTVLSAANVIIPTITITNFWESTGANSKNQYANYAGNIVNTSNVIMSLSLNSSNFDIQSSDYILIGAANITGSDITGLGIGTGNTANITISSNLITEQQTTASSAVTARLTTTAPGSNTATGTLLITTPPIPFSLSSVTGYWGTPNIIGNVGNSQPINWYIIPSAGDIIDGNIIVTGNANFTQSANTSFFGSTENVISTLGSFGVEASYLGTGLNGAGNSYSNVNTVLDAANIIIPSITITDVWTSSNSTSKNQYANYAANIVNDSDITMSLRLSSANFNIQPSDYILIGAANITGSNITDLGIGTGNTANITISSNLIPELQTAASSEVTARLTTTAPGSNTATGNTLTTVEPIPFSLANVTANWTYPTITNSAFVNQPINWVVNKNFGDVLSGNINVYGNANITQSANTTLSGSTENVNSTIGSFDVEASYLGSGLNGAGDRYSNVLTTLAAANISSLLYKTSSPDDNLPDSSSFSTASGANNWVPASNGAQSPGNTYGIATSLSNPDTWFYWLAFPDSLFWQYNGTSTTSGGAVGGNLYTNYNTSLGIINAGPSAAYGNGTTAFGGSGGNVEIGGLPYVVLGFTGFSQSAPQSVFIYGSTSRTA